MLFRSSFLAGGLAIWVSTQHTFVRYTSFRSGWLHLLDAGPFPYIGFAVVSISIGLATLFMTRPNRLHTKQDGAVARGLLRGAEERDSVVACLEIFDIENDQRPRDWDPELLRRACAGPEGSPFRTLGMWLRVYPLFDTGQHEAARKALDEVLSVWKNQDDGPLADVWADRVYAGVLVGEPIEELSQIFNTKLPGFQDWRMFRLARAAMLLHDGKNEAALKEAGWTLHFIHEPHTGVDKFVIERLQEIAREASARLGVSEEQAPVA